MLFCVNEFKIKCSIITVTFKKPESFSGIRTRVIKFLTITIPRYVWSLMRACWRWCGIVYSVCVGGWVNLTPDMSLLVCTYIFQLLAFMLKARLHTCEQQNACEHLFFRGFEFHLLLWIGLYLCVCLHLCAFACAYECVCQWISADQTAEPPLPNSTTEA